MYLRVYLRKTQDEIAVQNVLDQFFTGMTKRDTIAISGIIHPSARMQTVNYTTEGKAVLQENSVLGFKKQIEYIPKETKIEERILFYDAE